MLNAPGRHLHENESSWRPDTDLSFFNVLLLAKVLRDKSCFTTATTVKFFARRVQRRPPTLHALNCGTCGYSCADTLHTLLCTGKLEMRGLFRSIKRKSKTGYVTKTFLLQATIPFITQEVSKSCESFFVTSKEKK